ncbi:F-type H+-transporting ATPase subunit b [Desulfatibacillum alkenivorans DSM 16219]|jgi:F-type H+-transporting ATPase subunit b|uniref:ATP synthase subunit b n=1 Tax=Desulfatibacillum alkenivorans DSM 16219 TaxID=1121393 RepID=A0A1M6JNP5_9BACT|nr:ATP synthase F0 subunit B [Desulfatibacillum alkenivorans]SHJ48327.1 F-type H+-transporting ATPase subunit b [Desulfatibacillum alkenivorans DSM 16219]
MIKVIPDITVVWQIINFLVLVVVLNMVLFKPIRKGLQERKTKFSGLARGIETDKTKAAEQEQTLSTSLLKAKNEGAAKKEAIVAEATEQEQGIINEINDKAAKDLEELRAKIAGEVKNAETALEKEVDAFAATIGEKILGRALS